MSNSPLKSRGAMYATGTPSYRTSVPIESWSQQRQDAADAKLRAPIALGAERIRLAAQRVDHLREEIESLDTRLNNAPWFVDQRHMVRLEQHLSRMTDELYKERLNAWKDLRDLLLEPIADASLDRLRASWLHEILALQQPSGAQSPQGSG